MLQLENSLLHFTSVHSHVFSLKRIELARHRNVSMAGLVGTYKCESCYCITVIDYTWEEKNLTHSLQNNSCRSESGKTAEVQTMASKVVLIVTVLIWYLYFVNAAVIINCCDKMCTQNSKNQALYDAAYDGDLSKVKDCPKSGAKVDVEIPDSVTQTCGAGMSYIVL